MISAASARRRSMQPMPNTCRTPELWTSTMHIRHRPPSAGRGRIITRMTVRKIPIRPHRRVSGHELLCNNSLPRSWRAAAGEHLRCRRRRPNIYKFRGATVENILSAKAVPGRRIVIRLEQEITARGSILARRTPSSQTTRAQRAKTLWTAQSALPVTLFERGMR